MRMHKKAPLPGALDKPLDDFVAGHIAPSSSRVPPIHREVTTCYAYMCAYAYGCTEKTSRPAQVLMRRCMRYKPENCESAPAFQTTRSTCSPSGAIRVRALPMRPPLYSTSCAPTVRCARSPEALEVNL